MKFKLDYFKVQKLIKEVFEKEGPKIPKGSTGDDQKKDKKKKDPNAPTFPMDYILFKFPNIKVVLTELLTTTFSDYIDNIYVMAPKPTTFKVVLKNKQDFLIIYNERSYIVKVSGKKYYLLNLGERERAIKAVADLLNSKRFITSKVEDEDSKDGPDKEKGAKLGRPKGSGGGGSSLSDLGPDSKDDKTGDEELPELPDDILNGLEGGPEDDTTGEEVPEDEPLKENFKIRIVKNPSIEMLFEQFSADLELENFQNQLSEDQEVEEITAEQAAELVRNAGSSMFTVEFTKRDGSHRVLNGRRGVKKHLKGGTLPYSTEEKGLISVYDMQAPVGQGYRMIPKDSIVAIRINGKNYRVVQKKTELEENYEDRLGKNLAKKKYFINQAIQNKISQLPPGTPSRTDKQFVQNIEYYQQLVQQSRFSPRTKEFIEGVINNIKQHKGLASPKQLTILQKLKLGQLQEIEIKQGPTLEEVMRLFLELLNNEKTEEHVRYYALKTRRETGRRNDSWSDFLQRLTPLELNKIYQDLKHIENPQIENPESINEMEIRPYTHIFPPKYEPLLNNITQNFGEGNSGFELMEPMSYDYELINWEDEPDSKEHQNLLKLCQELGSEKGRTYVMKDLFGFDISTEPERFDTCIRIYKDYLTVSSPYIGEDRDDYVGWFDYTGKYIPDIKNFDKKGKYIGNAN